MTSDEKLDLILAEVKNLKSETKDLKSEMRDFQSETKDFQSEMKDFQSEMRDFQSEMRDFQSEMRDFKKQQLKSISELKAMDSMIFSEVERVHEIMLRRTDELKQKIG